MFASSEIKDERKSRYGGGPHGLGKHFLIVLSLKIYPFKNHFHNISGDPDSYKLRKIEQNVVIPKIIRERAKYEKCSEENKGNCTTFRFINYLKKLIVLNCVKCLEIVV